MIQMIIIFVLSYLIWPSKAVKTGFFLKNVKIPDKETYKQTDIILLFNSYPYIHMIHVIFLLQRLLVSETQTDRQMDIQDKFVIDICIYICIY